MRHAGAQTIDHRRDDLMIHAAVGDQRDATLAAVVAALQNNHFAVLSTVEADSPHSAGVGLVLYAFAGVIRGGVEPAPSVWRALLPATLGSSLILALLLNLAACMQLAQGAIVVPVAQDEALIHLELWGFASTMVLAISGRVFPKFLLLQPTRDGLIRPALALWALGSIGSPAVWLLLHGAPAARTLTTLAQLVAAVLFVVGLRLYELPVRTSGTPYVTNPTRRWARLAFAMVLAAASANLGIATAETLGVTTTVTQLSAARHVLVQGFLLPLIVLIGAALRGGVELVGGYTPGWSLLSALGGTLAVVTFTAFAVGLWRSTGTAPPAAASGRKSMSASHSALRNNS